MDTMNFLIAIIIMMLAASYDAYWLVIGVGAVMMLTMRSLNTIVLMLIAIAVVVFFRGNIQEYASYILFGLIILALALGNKQPTQQDLLPPDMGMGMGGLGMGAGY